MSDVLVIESVSVRRDENGRYCLNDLHRAAGHEPRHRPNYWLETQATAELTQEIEKAGFPAILTKQGLGTFVCKELVYAYAMWISPAFNLKVIRTFDAAVTGQNLPVAPQRQLTPMEMIAQMAQSMVDAERRASEQEAAIKRLETQVEAINAPLSHCPSNAEPITRIRRRVFAEYGVPANVCDFALYHLPYSPRPAGLVRNSREEAQGATYTVWWVKDISTLFRRFVGECTRITPAFVTHPSIEGRFRMSPGVEG